MKRIIAALLLFFLAVPFGWTQQQKTYSQPELDRMLAPIALYPDPLLSQVLMASTYPIEVVEAARWTRANPGLRGDDAVRAVEGEDWDPSVKSLVAFPQILQRMDENLEWTRSLGDAFLAQQPHVMDTVQQLRQRAYAAGNLQSNEHLQVQQQDRLIYIQPVHPQYVYVPYYDPYVVYGPWWWPAYRPVAWAPWPGYVRARPGVTVSFWWGAPIAISTGFFFGRPDWPHRHVRVVHNHYYRPPVVVNRTVVVERDRDRWHHNPHHRRGVEYRDATVRQQFAASSQASQEQRRERRAPQPQVQQQAAPQRQVAPQQQAAPQRQAQPQVQQQPQAQPQPQARPQQRDEERERRRAERRQERPVARDLQDSKVLSPQPRPAEPRPQQQAQERPQHQVQPRPQQQVQPRPQQQAQERPRAVQQEERREAREERREQRQDARQERRETQPPRGHAKGHDRS